MEHPEKKETGEVFSYTYSAREREEVQKIRQKYMPKEPDKMEQLRMLDRSVTKKGTIVSLMVGILGTLVLGVGMCCTMVWSETLFIPGVVIGLAGMALVGLAYPLYAGITRREREKAAPEILRLSEELMK